MVPVKVPLVLCGVRLNWPPETQYGYWVSPSPTANVTTVPAVL